MTFPSGPLASSAQLLAQSHIYTLQTHTPTHTHTHTLPLSLYLALSFVYTHTHARAYMSNVQSARKSQLPLTQNVSSKGRGYLNQATEVKHWHFITAHSVTYTRPSTHMIRGIFHPCRGVYWPSGPHVRAQCLHSIQLSASIILPAHSV